jgi:hypothetical protein
MDLWSTLALIRKWRYLAGLMLLVTLGGSFAAVAQLTPVVEVNSALVLLLPAAESPDGNPYTSGFENQVLATLVAKNLSSPAAVQSMVALGADRQYEVTADSGFTAALVHVIARNQATAEAFRTVAVVSQGVKTEVERLQRASGAPEATWIRAVPLASSPTTLVLAGSRVRPLAALVLASLLVSLGMTFLVEGFGRRQARKRVGRPTLEEAPPWLAFVDPGTDPQSDTLAKAALAEADLPGTPSRRRRPLDAVDALTIFVVLLLALPARLVFKQLGAAGTPANMWGLVLLLWWTAHRLIPSRRSVTFQPVRLGIQFLGLAAVLSYAAAFFRPIDVVEIFAADRGLISLAAWSGVALVAVDGITTYGRLRRLLDRVASAGAALAGLGLVQFFTAIDVRPWFHIPFLSVNGDLELVFVNSRAGFNRVAGTTNHPIEFSVVLAMILPLALHLAFHAEASRKRRAWVRVALIGVAVPMSVSRTGILGLLVGGVILFVSWPAQRRWRAVLLTPIFAVGLRLLAPGLLGSIRNLFLNIQRDNSFTGRTDDYSIATRIFSRAPWFGRGWGTLLPDRYVLLDNQLLKTLLEGGLFAVVALLLLFALGIGAASGAYHRAADDEARDLGQTFVAAIAIGMVSFVTFDAFAFATVPATLFLVLGCSGALWRLTLVGDSRYQAPEGRSISLDASPTPVTV